MSVESSGQLQNLRDFTVQIRTPDQQAIVGTGMVVAADGLVVTCLHVAQAARAHDGAVNVGDEVGVYFPRAVEDGAKKRKATVHRILQGYDDDAVLLQVQGDSLPVTEDQVAVLRLDGDLPAGVTSVALGDAKGSDGHSFRAFGYPPVGNVEGLWATGKIEGLVRKAGR